MVGGQKSLSPIAVRPNDTAADRATGLGRRRDTPPAVQFRSRSSRVAAERDPFGGVQNHCHSSSEMPEFLLSGPTGRIAVRKALGRTRVVDYPSSVRSGFGRKGLFAKLEKIERIWAGRLIALLYLFCVTAPSAALALGTAPAPCFADELSAVGSQLPHVHAKLYDGDSHVQSQVLADAGGAVKHRHDDHNAPGPCCAMLCITALSAQLPVIVKPLQPASTRIGEKYQSPTGRAPPVLYRPPIV